MAERVAAIAKAPESEQKCRDSCRPNPGRNSSGSSADRILQLQRTAGNQAVQRLIKSGALQKNHKGVSSETLPDNEKPQASPESAVESKAISKREMDVEIENPEEGKALENVVDPVELDVKEASASPENDSAFQSVVKQVKKTATKEKFHATAKVKSSQAQAAAVSPSNEVASKAAAIQVQEMNQAEPRSFDRAAFKAALIEKIESITPKNLKEADELKESGKVKSIKGDLTMQVVRSKEQSQGEIKEKVEQAPDNSGIEPKLVTPLPPAESGPKPKSINASQAAPKPRPETDVSLQEGNRALERRMASDNITDEMLEKSNEPDFVAAVNAKQASQTNATEAPQVYRKEEQSTLSKSQSEMTLLAHAQIEAMHVSRQKQLSQVSIKQVNVKGIDEKKREEVANHIQEIFKGTREKVEACLSKLDKDVDTLFDKGANEAQTFFENYIDYRMKMYKLERYGGPNGVLRWLHDAFFDLPDEVNRFYEDGRKLYLKMMDNLLNRIAETVETGLRVAKNEISSGKKDIKKYVDSLPVTLKSVGLEAAKSIQSDFDNLEQSVNDKQNQLIDSLSKKYVDKVQLLNTKIKDMRAENRGLLNKAKDAIKGVAETIKRLRNMLSNALSRAREAVYLIISDPIGFLRNLVKGVKLGFQNFVGKIDKYLIEGLMGWLFGALAEAGIQMPESFDLKGILSVVLQILGLTYQNIRYRAVKIVGEKVVNTMERTASIFQALLTKGPAAIWEEIKEKLVDFKSMILVPIKDFIISKIITAGVTWILGLLNPVAAFIKAAKAIYDIIMFFVERASQIMALINAVVDSIISIAVGNIAVAATKVEQALAKAIPVVIGLLAAILGLGGISERVKSIIKKIQNPIEIAIDWVIEKAIKPYAMKAKEFVELGKEKVIGAGKAVAQVGLPKDPNERLKLASQAAVSAAKKLTGRVTQALLNPVLAGIKVRYGLKAIQPYKKDGTWWVKATINPEVEQDLGVPSGEDNKGADKQGSNLSDEVKMKVKNDLEGQKKELESADELKGLLQTLFNKYRKEGLKSIRILPTEPDMASIVVSASADLTIGHIRYAFKTSGPKKVVIFMRINEFWSPKDISHENIKGGLHAEEILIKHFPRIIGEYKKDHPRMPPEKVEVFVKYSPCMEEDHYCALKLVELKQKYPNILEWAVFYYELYGEKSIPKINRSIEGLVLLQKNDFIICGFELAVGLGRIRMGE